MCVYVVLTPCWGIFKESAGTDVPAEPALTSRQACECVSAWACVSVCVCKPTNPWGDVDGHKYPGQSQQHIGGLRRGEERGRGGSTRSSTTAASRRNISLIKLKGNICASRPRLLSSFSVVEWLMLCVLGSTVYNTTVWIKTTTTTTTALCCCPLLWPACNTLKLKQMLVIWPVQSRQLHDTEAREDNLEFY